MPPTSRALVSDPASGCAGGLDEGGPADRTHFAPGYYAANVADFDGNRLEFVHKAWNAEP